MIVFNLKDEYSNINFKRGYAFFGTLEQSFFF